MIKYVGSQIILSGSTGSSFNDKMNKPDKEIMIKRNKYFNQIDSKLIVKTVDGKIYIK